MHNPQSGVSYLSRHDIPIGSIAYRVRTRGIYSARCPYTHTSSKDFEIFMDCEENVVLGFNTMLYARQQFLDPTPKEELTWFRKYREVYVFERLCGNVRCLSSPSPRM